jgi:hypothetical protein
MEKGISYLNRTFKDYKDSLINYTKQYYPELEQEFNDASIGSWLIDVVANVGDNLSYHIDRVFQETNINSANEKNSIQALARNNNVKIPGPKAAITEVKFSCEIPVSYNVKEGSKSPNWDYAPLIKRGTKVSAGNQIYELMEDVDFQQQFNENNISNRLFVPQRNANGEIVKYIVSKTGIVMAGETKIYSKTISNSDITPFMSFVIPDNNVMNVESIIFKDGTNHNNTPTLNDFYYPHESNVGKNDCGVNVSLWRFFEVDYLAQQYRWGDSKNEPVKVEKLGEDGEFYCIRKGAWVPLRQKFITEFTDKNYLKVIFGAGNQNLKEVEYSQKYTDVDLISHVINNDGLGILPNPNTTMYILYRKGGGSSSNVAEGAINSINYLSVVLRGDDANESAKVKRSFKVTNTVPGVSGRNAPSVEEMKYIIKYNNGAQDRCVTIKDYHDRIAKMPARYGCPFRYSVTEENNKIMIYLLGLNSDGKLNNTLPEILQENIKEYISGYKMINDYVEIKSGRFINLRFQVEFYIENNYDPSNVTTNIYECIKNYMDINRLQMGSDIFVGDIEKEISKIDGVSNLISLNVYNVFGGKYSDHKTTQLIKTDVNLYNNGELIDNGDTSNMDCIDLSDSDKMLYSENDTMFEIRFPETDIMFKIKRRNGL